MVTAALDTVDSFFLPQACTCPVFPRCRIQLLRSLQAGGGECRSATLEDV